MDNTSIKQYSQDDSLTTEESLEDAFKSSEKNIQLDKLQITNIGTGLLGNSPFSLTSGKINTNIGFDRINQSLKLIIRTIQGEVPMLPILGAGVATLLFEPADEIMVDALEDLLSEKIAILEPRIKVMNINILLDRVDENMVEVQIEYRLVNSNITYKFRDSIVTGNGGDVL